MRLRMKMKKNILWCADYERTKHCQQWQAVRLSPRMRRRKMKFHTVGNESGKIIVLIHGMLNPWQIWMDVANAFSEEYYVVIPELDAHTQEEPSHFISVEDEAAKIHDYLIQNFDGELYMLCGLSMGGRIAAALAGLQGISTEYLILDGAPLFPVPKIVIKFMTGNYIRIIQKSRKRDPKVFENFKKDFLP